MEIEGWKVKRSACDGHDAMAVMKSLLNSPETWVPGTATLPGQTSLIRCFVRHGRRRWFQTIWVKGSRLMFFLTVGSLCSFYNPQLKNNQLASIVESTEKESVLGSTEIYTLGLTFAFLLLLRSEDFWKAFNVNEFGPCNVLLRVAVATISSPYWMVSRAGHRGVGFLASLFAFLRWARHFVSWIHFRLFFVRSLDSTMTHLCHESIARRNDVSESGTEESCVPNILWIGSSIQLVWNRWPCPEDQTRTSSWEPCHSGPS